MIFILILRSSATQALAGLPARRGRSYGHLIIFYFECLTNGVKKSDNAIHIWYGGVAQGLEQWNHNPCVASSNLASATIFFFPCIL